METIDVAGHTRTYTLVTPPGGDYSRLLLVFHGSTQNAGIFRRFTGNSFDHLSGTAVAYLDGFKGNWNDARKGSRFPARVQNVDDVAFAEAVVKRTADGRETFAAGFSNGGGMVIRLLHERPDLLAGAAVIAAQQPTPDNFLLPELPVVPKPVLLFHGTKDRIIPYAGGQMAAWARLAFKVRGEMLSAPETAAYFATRNGITTPPVTTELPPGPANPAPPLEAGRPSAVRPSAHPVEAELSARPGRAAELSARSGGLAAPSVAAASRFRPGRPAGTSVTRTDYRQDGRAPVTLYTVHGAGHTIPGPKPSPALMGRTATDLNAAQEIAAFFAARSTPADPVRSVPDSRS